MYTDNVMAAITNACSATDPATGAPKDSLSSWIVPLTAKPLSRLFRGRRALLNWLRHDADVRDPRLLYSIHDRGKGAKRDALVGLDINDLVRGIDTRSRQP